MYTESKKDINWWIISAAEIFLLLLLLVGFGVMYQKQQQQQQIKSLVGDFKIKLQDEESSSLDRIDNNSFGLAGVKVEINRIGYDKFLSTIIGSLGDIEEVKIASYTGIYTTYASSGKQEQDLYVLAKEGSDQVVVITVTNDSVTEEDIVGVVESLNEELVFSPSPTVKPVVSVSLKSESPTLVPTLTPTPTLRPTPDPTNFGDCIYGCVSETRFNN